MSGVLNASMVACLRARGVGPPPLELLDLSLSPVWRARRSRGGRVAMARCVRCVRGGGREVVAPCVGVHCAARDRGGAPRKKNTPAFFASTPPVVRFAADLSFTMGCVIFFAESVESSISCLLPADGSPHPWGAALLRPPPPGGGFFQSAPRRLLPRRALSAPRVPPGDGHHRPLCPPDPPNNITLAVG